MDNFHLHDHCESCISRYCQFELVEDVSCNMVFCENDCGQKFHQCKQYDHNETCLNHVIDCINKQYGCPRRFKRMQLGAHLEFCPANVLICTMEWNRWHHGSLISMSNWKHAVKAMEHQQVVDKNLDIVCAIRDQSILMETVMPSSVLEYFSDLVDDQGKVIFSGEHLQQNNDEHACASGERGNREVSSSLKNKYSEADEKCLKGKHRDEGHLMSTTHRLLKYMESEEIINDQDSRLYSTEGNSTKQCPRTSVSPNHSCEANMCVNDRRDVMDSTVLPLPRNSSQIDSHVQDFKGATTEVMSLVNALDSDVCIVINVVNDLLDKVVASAGNQPTEDANLPVIDWKEEEIPRHSDIKSKCYELQQSVSKLLQEIGSVHGRSEGTPNSSGSSAKKTGRRKRSWLFRSNIKSGGYVSSSWGWLPRKDVVDASTDTRDLVYDKSSLEWLSPEAFVSQEDAIFRLFSVIGATSRAGSPFEEKQLNHFVMESSTQTVAPFLLSMDMNSIGRALCSASLSSSVKNPDERCQMLSLLKSGSKIFADYSEAPVKLANKLKYNNLALGNILESVPRYQTKPPSMYSFMCGCVVRRDQFSSHVQNIHCEIMSGLNGWIEQKCPYAAYGCNHSEPRFCPDHRCNAVVYDQTESTFTVSPGHWGNGDDQSFEPSPCSTSFLDLPYEVHEKIFRFVDCYAIRQLSRTCTYFRELCKHHLVTRGIVQTKWIKRFYDDGTRSWKMGKQVWSFPPTSAKINRWVLSECPPMVNHVSKCSVVAEYDVKYKEERVRVLPNR